MNKFEHVWGEGSLDSEVQVWTCVRGPYCELPYLGEGSGVGMGSLYEVKFIMGNGHMGPPKLMNR